MAMVKVEESAYIYMAMPFPNPIVV
ncbi:uncharacterized protein G2W53_022878 [Senna tora]|uniref:Uncharacterized protein n=1 Tax=Senna tora TaxID=362788 RepID=A0A834WPM5_9FABA|nr:uncharacterized protein G2W53_022878 [Senna tora]